MEDPCRTCIVNTMCKWKDPIDCKKLWDYESWKFEQQVISFNLFKGYKKKRGQLNEIHIHS